MSGKTKIMSISLEPEMHETMIRAAKRMGMASTSDLVRKLVKNFAIDREDVKAVVFQIPIEILNDRPAMTKWLSEKSEALVNHFCKEKV